MPRIRSIKPEFWTDDKIISLPHIARLFFIGVWNFADDYGALQDKPEQLRLLILPSETDMNAEQALDLLISCDLVERYVDETRDESFLMIKNWGKHQKVDHPTKSRIIPERYKKVVIPQSVRREVAIKYGCLPGSENMNECYFCGDPGKIYWTKKSNGSPSGWVSFSHELSHIIPEQEGGETSKGNIVLCCRNCNRSMGVKNAFDWLFSGKYTTNQTRDNISKFRENSRKLEKSIESSLLIGKERIGEDRIRKGKEGGIDFENNSTNNEEKYIIPQMCKVWYEVFPLYTSDRDNDLEGMGKILKFIFKQAGEPQNKMEESGTQEKVLNTVRLVANNVNENKFWTNKPIKSIANHIQEFYNNIKNPINGKSNSKTQPTGADVSGKSIHDTIMGKSSKTGNL